MAHKKGVGSSKNGRESESKRLGVKIFGGQYAKAGNILIRQRGTKHHPGENVGIGKDHTLFALIDGTVAFRRRKNNKSFVSVEPIAVAKSVAGEILSLISPEVPVAEPVVTEVVTETVAETIAAEVVAAEPVAEVKPKTSKPRTKKVVEEN